MGLPVDRPIVMSGHQAGFWHGGIIAKYFAVQAACAAFDAAGAWVVVDQDDNPADLVSWCVADQDGRLREAHVRMLASAIPGGSNGSRSSSGVEHVPSGSIGSSRVTFGANKEGQSPALPSIAAGLTRIEQAMHGHLNEPTLARQIGAATRDLIQEAAPEPTPTWFYATDLCRTDLFGWLVERMSSDPVGCVNAYNDAVMRHPEAGMARLRVPTAGASDGERGVYELPLWALGPRDRGGKLIGPPRKRVTSATVREVPREELAPRALLMTALVRLAGCDAFIHGTGGAAYDRVTDEWIRAWLGESLAPTAMVTATMLLPLASDFEGALSASRAAWVAHRAEHDPALLGDRAAAMEKERLVNEIRDARSRGERPLASYRTMHALLEDVRTRHADRLNELKTAAVEAKTSASQATLAADRTWPFPLFQNDDLAKLATEIRSRFA